MEKAKLQKELENRRAIEDCAKEFGVLGDETRLKICYLLCRHPGLSVGDIADVLNLSLSAISHSLRKLSDLGVVKRHRKHKWAYYHLCDTTLTRYIKRSLAGSVG